MKKLIFVLAAFFMIAVSANAQTSANLQEQPPKEHVCTQQCHDSGHHVYAHGEKEHVCGNSCVNAKPKKHACTQQCHDKGMHVYQHGEKNHVCTEACNGK